MTDPSAPIRRDVDALLRAGIDAGAICGAVLAVGAGGADDQEWTTAIGREEPTADAHQMHAGVVFDLASLTKVVATLPVILTLVSTGEIGLEDPVHHYLPEFGDGPQRSVTIRHLLAHTSGLPAARRYYREFTTADRIRAAVLAEQPVVPPGSLAHYSDLGFILLGFVAEAVAETGLDEAARRLVFDPLGMTSTRFAPAPDDAHYAPTESFDGAPPLRGIVHDRNARLLGGVAGHAGLFAPVSDMVTYLRVWLRETEPPWGPALTETALARQTPPGGPARGLGWVLADESDPGSLLHAWRPGAAGHTGFTGTSVAFHPGRRLWAVLLTNAIRCGRDKTRLALLRRDVHRRVADVSVRAADPDDW